MKTKPSLEKQLYLYLIAAMVAAIILSMAIALYYSLESKMDSLDTNIKNVGLIVSSSDYVVAALESGESTPALHANLDKIVAELDYVDVITVGDTESIRLYHNNKYLIGETFVGKDEGEILAGAEPYVLYGEGTLGPQRRAFHAVRGQGGEIIGFVMVSVLTSSITALRNRIILTYLLLTLVLVAAGMLLAYLFNRRLRHTLLGHNPEEFKRMYLERSEVLDALEEGIFAINTRGEITLMNESAREMLDLETEPPAGTKLTSVYPETKLPQVLTTGETQRNVNFKIRDAHIIADRIPIYEKNKIVGAVSIFRNKTEVTQLAEELTGAKYMVDTLRAFNHEFMNKLHVILGYIEMGDNERAISYVHNTSLVSTQAVKEVAAKIQEPRIAALIIGKILRASELGITLTLKTDVRCREGNLLIDANAATTLIGNLIDNAIEELNRQDFPVKEIEVGIYTTDRVNLFTVDDTGAGMSEEVRAHVFQRGYSTKGEGRGTGMALIKETVELYNGQLEIETEAGEGTAITVTFMEEDKHVPRDDR